VHARVFGLLTLVLGLGACEERPVARPKTPVAVARPDFAARERARQWKVRGLETPSERAAYVHILADACEARHDPQACMDAAAVDKKLGRTLLFHGCSLGEDAACTAYMNAEVNDDKRSKPLARFDAQLALEQGCAYSGGNACITLAKWTGVKPPIASNRSSSTPIRVEQLQNVDDLRVAQQACVLACGEELKGCTERCSKSPMNATDCIFACSDVDLSCAMSCKKAAHDACLKLPNERCGRLDL